MLIFSCAPLQNVVYYTCLSEKHIKQIGYEKGTALAVSFSLRDTTKRSIMMLEPQRKHRAYGDRRFTLSRGKKMNLLTAIKAMLPVVQFGVTSGTGIGMIFAFCKFAHKPTDTLKQRVAELEDRVDSMEKTHSEFKADVERKLQEHNEHFEDLDKANKIIMQSLLAIMDNALGNDGSKTKLSKSRDDLFNYLNER